jgi:ECF sigma factor
MSTARPYGPLSSGCPRSVKHCVTSRAGIFGARTVECRFLGGMSVDETAAALGVSVRTVKSDWALARVWLHGALREISA